MDSTSAAPATNAEMTRTAFRRDLFGAGETPSVFSSIKSTKRTGTSESGAVAGDSSEPIARRGSAAAPRGRAGGGGNEPENDTRGRRLLGGGGG